MRRPAATITTARLTLRPLREDDADAIAGALGNYNVVRWLAAPPYPYHRADAQSFIRITLDQRDTVWAIEDAGGLCGVIGIDPDLGFWLARDVWGRGYATEAGDAVIDAWFRGTRARWLTARHFAENSGSATALAKMGFVDVGALPIQSRPLNQHVAGRLMELSRERWTARRRFRLATPRTRLRELRDRDLAALRRIGGDARVASMIVGATAPWAEDDARRWLEAAKYRGRPGFRAAIRNRMGRLIGTVMLGRRAGRGPVETAYFLDPAVWGRGLATEAVGAFLADCMDRFDLPQIGADHFVDNPAGGAVLRKLGFRQTGRGLGRSSARLEPAPVVIYRLERQNLKVPR